MTYRDRLRLNLTLGRIKALLTSLLFFMPVWYAFETQFAPPETLAVIYAATHLVTVFLELPTGALADLVGRRTTVVIGLVLEGAAWLYISGARGVTDLWLGYAVSEIGVTLVSGADTALSYDTLKELGDEHGYSAYYAKNNLIYRLGIIAATFIGGYAFGVSRGLPYAMVGVCLIAAGVATLGCTEPRIDSEKFTLRTYLRQTRLGLKEIIRTPYIRDLSLYYVSVGSITWYFIYFLYLVYLSEQRFSAVELGWMTAGINMAIGIGVYVLTRRIRMTRTAGYLLMPVLMLASFLPAVFVHGYATVILVFLGYFAAVSRWSILDQYVNLEFSSKYRATAISALSMIISVSYTVISIGVGPVLSRWGASGVMGILGLLTLTTSVPAALRLIRTHAATRP